MSESSNNCDSSLKPLGNEIHVDLIKWAQDIESEPETCTQCNNNTLPPLPTSHDGKVTKIGEDKNKLWN